MIVFRTVAKRSQSRVPIRFFVFIVPFLSACGNGAVSPALNEPTGEPKFDASKVDREGSLTVAKKKSRVQPFTTVFDFSTHLHRAHLRSGGLLIDFGTPSRHKYTLGDWKSGWAGDFEENDVTYSTLRGPVAHLFFDRRDDESQQAVITFRARGETRTGAKVYLNGEYKGRVAFHQSTFSHAALTVTSDLKTGPNELLIRCDGPRRRSATRTGCIAVDYIRIAHVADNTGTAAAAFDSVRYPSAKGGPDGILLNATESLTFHLPIDPGMQIRGQARARGTQAKATIEIVATSNNLKEENLLTKKVGGALASFTVDLTRFAGDSIALEFRSDAGEVVMDGVELGSAPPPSVPAPGHSKAKNVLLVLIDTLRADKLSLYNKDTRVRTSCMDQLGLESMVFERAFAPENWTKPSVASLLSGLYPATHKAKDDRDKVPSTVVMAAEHFREIGFDTAGFVANGYVSGKFGFRQGWDTWTNYVRESKANRAKHVMKDTIDWLLTRKSDKPFFLYVHTIDPHVPYIPPQKYLEMYDPIRYRGPIKSSQTAHQLAAIKTGKLKLNDRDKARLEALYDGEITYHDDQFIALVETLKTEGRLEDTLIIVTSDHGEEFFDHGSVGHGHSMYEELLHVPLLIRLPGAEKREPVMNRSEVNLVDVLPTICEILGVECPSGMEGNSLVPLLEGTGSGPYPNCVFSEFLGGQLAARMGRYKVIYKGLLATLFDLSKDPGETENVRDQRPISLATLRDSVGLHVGALSSNRTGPASKQKTHRKVKANIDEETRAQLKALGYLNED